MTPTFFESPAAFRNWLLKHHAMEAELLVGYYKRGSGVASLTWPESVDAALCFGWIDGVRRRLDESRYTIRFTPRRPSSVWSAVNVRRVKELVEQGRMRPAGLKAFEARTEKKSGIYAYEQVRSELSPPYAKQLEKNRAAWAFFLALPAWYRHKVCWWVMSAKQEQTRLRRLEKLIADSAQGRRS